MKYLYGLLLGVLIGGMACAGHEGATDAGTGNGGATDSGAPDSGAPDAGAVFFPADNPNIQYMGRVDFSNPKLPRFWAPGVVVSLKFRGPTCRVLLRDEVLYGKSHNYIGIAVDGRPAYRIKTHGQEDTLVITGADGAREHVVSICKDTESGIGWLELVGVLADSLLPPPTLPERKIECIGNSITCGAGMDLADIPCDKGEWYDQHNAWMSYGALTARALKAQWHLTAVSGIGLIHSCCKMTETMPEAFDKMNGRENTGAWDFSLYQPDVVTICLGQNDGIQDSTAFCGAYLRFIGQVRHVYPKAQIVLLTSPMGNAELTAVLKRYIGGVVAAMRRAGDERVSDYFFSRQWSHGCGGHPDMGDHSAIAGELTGYLRGLMGW